VSVIKRELKMSALRGEVLRLYKNILRVASRWEAVERNETKVERNYMRDEARELFRLNAGLTSQVDIKERIKEGETRLTMAIHYQNPYPRPVNIPKHSYAKREGKKVGKAVQKMHQMSRPVYLKSMEEVRNKAPDVLQEIDKKSNDVI